MSRNSAAFEAYCDRAFDDERDYDQIAADEQDRLMDAADSHRKGEG